MRPDETPMSSQRREQVLENCRWLFGQEVQLITFFRSFDNCASNAFTALILPKACSLRDSHTDFNSRILWRKVCKAEGKKWATREDVIDGLLWEVEYEMGKILQTDQKGEFQINEGAIPRICREEATKEVKESVKEAEETPQKIVEATVIEEEKANDMVEMCKLDEKSISGGIMGNKVGMGQKIWRVVGYTPSGEPCIKEHEPENDSPPPPTNFVILDSSKAPYSPSEYNGSRMAEMGLAPLTIGRSTMSDIEAATAHDDLFPVSFDDNDELRNFDEDVKQINQLIATTAREGYARLAEVQYGGISEEVSRHNNPSAAYQKTLKDQDTAVKNLLFRINKKNQRLVALAALLRQAEELHNREKVRANESEAREIETNTLLEKLFKIRGSGGDSGSGRSGIASI